MNGNFLGFLFAAENYFLTNDAIKITSINLLRNGENGENVTEMCNERQIYHCQTGISINYCLQFSF